MEKQEVDLCRLFLLFWQKKWIIIGSVIGAVLGMLTYSVLFVKRTYEASSTVLITPPSLYNINISDMPYGVYHNVAQSDLMLQEVIKRIDLKDKNDNLISVKHLRRLAGVSLDKDFTNVGFLIFKAVDTDPHIPCQIVNAWGEIVIEDIVNTRQKEVEEIANTINKQYLDTEEKLNEAQTRLRNHKKDARLEVLEKTMINYRNQVERNEIELIQLEQNLERKKSEFREISTIIKSMQMEDGTWIGSLSKDSELEDTSVSFQSIHNYKTAMNAFLDFMENNNLAALENKLDFLEKRLNSFRHEKVDLEKKLNSIAKEKEEIENLLAQRINGWSTDAPPNGIESWDEFFTQEEIIMISQMSSEKEIISSLYEGLKAKQADALIGLAVIPEQIRYLEESIIETDKDILATHREIMLIKDQEGKLLKDLELYEELYKRRQTDFNDLKNDHFALQIEINRLEAERNVLIMGGKQLLAKLTEVEEQFWELENERDRLEHIVKEYQATYHRLSEKVEEVRLALAEQAQDVRFVTRAMHSGNPVPKGTATRTSVAGVLAAMLAVFGVLTYEFIKGESGQEKIGSGEPTKD